jgi:hypothetical protein
MPGSLRDPAGSVLINDFDGDAIMDFHRVAGFNRVTIERDGPLRAKAAAQQ